MNNGFFQNAIMRRPDHTAHRGLTTAELGEPDFEKLCEQHAAYAATLSELGLDVQTLDELPGFPDAYFVEDAAVIFPDVAVIARSGAVSRQGEQESIADALAIHRPLKRIVEPGTLDGGDVLVVGRQCFVGISSRTNLQGAEQLDEAIKPWGYQTITIPVGDGLHLKSLVNHLGQNQLILTGELGHVQAFSEFDKTIVSDDEKYSANTLWINDHLLVPRGFPDTLGKLKSLGKEVIEMDVSEFEKMDGGLTCLSLRF